jgi:hypothetical protein
MKEDLDIKGNRCNINKELMIKFEIIETAFQANNVKVTYKIVLLKLRIYS